MSNLHAAYLKLGMTPGTPLDAVKKRYRHLAMVWHPDRMTTPEGRRANEEELKQINNAFDCIKKHFQSEHQSGPTCQCQPGHGQSTGKGYAGGDGSSTDSQREKTTYEQWREQARTEAERRRRAEEAAQEAALKEALERAAREAAARAAAMAAAAKARATNPQLTEDQLRWYIAVGLSVMFALLLIGGFNKRYEPSSRPNSEFWLSNRDLTPCPF